MIHREFKIKVAKDEHSAYRKVSFIHFMRDETVEHKPGQSLHYQRRYQVPMDFVAPTSNLSENKEDYKGTH